MMKNEHLANLKKEHGLTNRKLGSALGISHVMYYNIESGIANVDYEMAVKIANLYNLKPDDIFLEYEKIRNVS